MDANFNLSVDSEIEFIFNNRDTLGNLEEMPNNSNLSFPSFNSFVPTTKNEQLIGEIGLVTSQEIERSVAVMSPVMPVSSRSKLSLRKEKVALAVKKLSLVRKSDESLHQSVDEEIESVSQSKSNVVPTNKTDELFGKIFDFCGVSPVLKDDTLNVDKCVEKVTVNVATEVNIISDILIKPAEKPANKSQSILRGLLAKPRNQAIPKRTSQIGKPTRKRSSQSMKVSVSLARTDNGAFIAPTASTSMAKPPKPCMIEPTLSTSTADPSTTFTQVAVIPSSSEISGIVGDGMGSLKILGTAIHSAADKEMIKNLNDLDNNIKSTVDTLRKNLVVAEDSLKEYIGMQKLVANTSNPGDTVVSTAYKDRIAKLTAAIADLDL